MIKDIVKEFSRHAGHYSRYSHIQRIAANRTVRLSKAKDLGNVLDIGCGDGEIYRQLLRTGYVFDKFFGLDLSPEMLTLHPSAESTFLLNADFADPDLHKCFGDIQIDNIFSSSSIQWCMEPDRLFSSLSFFKGNLYISFFTENTFGDFLSFAGLDSPVCPHAEILAAAEEHFAADLIQKERFVLYFDNTFDMLRYIKNSGVSGGRARLNYRETRKLQKEYPEKKLEVEIVYMSLSPKKG